MSRQLGRYLRFVCNYVKQLPYTGNWPSYFVTLFACTALSALWNVSRPNCSTYAWPAVSSTIASLVAFSALIYTLSTSAKADSESIRYLFQLVHQSRSILKSFVIAIMKASREYLIDYPVLTCRSQPLYHLRKG
jgi:hypothetical protein